MKLKCKICENHSVVWCGSDEHHNHSGDIQHDCHHLTCLVCDSIFDLGYAVGIKDLNGEDEFDQMKEAIIGLYENGLK